MTLWNKFTKQCSSGFKIFSDQLWFHEAIFATQSYLGSGILSLSLTVAKLRMNRVSWVKRCHSTKQPRFH